MEYNAGINVNSQFLELCGITASAESSSSSIWHTDQTSDDARERFASVDSLLRDYVTAFSPTDDVAGLLPRSRVNAILITSLGIAKQKLLKGWAAQVKPDAKRQLKTLFWGHDQFISVPVSFLNPCRIRTSALDYVLWYGNTGELETNLVVLRVDEALDGVVEEQYYFAALAAISMIHHNRTNRPIIQDTYGLVTDGLEWTFLHVNKEHEYSSLKLNWLEDEEQAIVGLIGKIMDHAVTVKMMYEETESIQLGRSLEWTKMATMWDSSQRKYSEEEEMDSLYAQALFVSTSNQQTSSNSLQDHLIPHSTIYPDRKMDWFADFKETCKDLIHRGIRGERVDHRLDDLFESASEKRNQGTSGHHRKRFESIAVTDIDPYKLMGMFRLRRENKPTTYWRLAPWEARQVSSHLATMLEQIRLVYGDADHNEAVIRLAIDAVFLDILASIKIEFGQYEEVKGNGKRPSTESTLSRKRLQMALETNISYIFPTHDPEEGVVEKLIRGRMDYTLWYGNPKEAETNLLVVEAKHRSSLAAGRYQAISYMAKSPLIQHARHKAGRAKTLIYGISTDSQDWDFIRMDASGNVDIKQFSWEANQGSQIVSLLHKIISEASTLSPVPSRDLTREKTVEEATGIRLTKNDGSPA
ncbi:hypothetical protein BJX76DRAFT_352681 [Aspergillus varians]